MIRPGCRFAAEHGLPVVDRLMLRRRHEDAPRRGGMALLAFWPETLHVLGSFVINFRRGFRQPFGNDVHLTDAVDGLEVSD